MRHKEPIPFAKVLKNPNNSKIDESLKFFISSNNNENKSLI